MTRHKYEFVSEWPELFFDGCDERIVVALRKVGTPDRPAKEYVAHESDICICAIENHVTGCVPRTMSNAEPLFAYPHLVILLQPASGLKRLSRREVEHFTLARQRVYPELVGFMGTFDGNL